MVSFDEYKNKFTCALLFATQGYRFQLLKNVILPAYANAIYNDTFLHHAISRIILVPNNLEGISIREYSMLAAEYKGLVDIEIIIGKNEYKVFNKFLPYNDKYRTQDEYIIYLDDDRFSEPDRLKSLIKANYVLMSDGYSVPIASYSYNSDGSGLHPIYNTIKLANCIDLYIPCFCCVLFPPHYYNTVFSKQNIYTYLNARLKEGITINNEETYFGYMCIDNDLPYAIDMFNGNIVDFYGYNSLYGRGKTVGETNALVPTKYYTEVYAKNKERTNLMIKNYCLSYEACVNAYYYDRYIANNSAFDHVNMEYSIFKNSHGTPIDIAAKDSRISNAVEMDIDYMSLKV